MSLILKDRCKNKVISSAGTGPVTLSTAVVGFSTISSVLSNGDTSYFCLESGNGAWEVFVGTYTSSGTTVSRDTVLASSNGGAKINLGTSITFCYIVAPADKITFKNSAGEIIVPSVGLRFSDASVQTTAATTPDLSPYATLASPTFTGVPVAPTATVGSNTTQLATTEFVTSAVGSIDLSPYLTTSTATSTYVALGGSYTNPSWITSLAWGKLSGVPSAVSNLSGINTGDQDLSSYATTAAIAAGYLPLAGGTLTGDLLFTDATYDIGKSGATRPRDGFFSRDVVVGTSASINNSGKAARYSLNVGVTSFAGLTDAEIVAGFYNAVFAGSNARISVIAGSGGESSLYLGDYSTTRVKLTSLTSNILEQRNSTNAQTFRLYNTYTSATTTEFLQFKTNTVASYQIGSAVGSAGGTTRGIDFGSWNSAGIFTSVLSIASDNTISINNKTINFIDAFAGVNSISFDQRGLILSSYGVTGLASYGGGIALNGTATYGVQITAAAPQYGTFQGNGNFVIGDFKYSNNAVPTTTFGPGFRIVNNTAVRNDTFVIEANKGSGTNNERQDGVHLFLTSSDGAIYGTATAANGGNLYLALGNKAGTGTAGKMEVRTLTGNPLMVVDYSGLVSLTGTSLTSGSPTAFTLTEAAHTTLSASTECASVNFNLSSTKQFTTGALTTQRAMRIQAPTYSFVGASTITTASTLSISGPPVAGTNATIANASSLYIESGFIRQDAKVSATYDGTYRTFAEYRYGASSTVYTVFSDSSGVFSIGNETYKPVLNIWNSSGSRSRVTIGTTGPDSTAYGKLGVFQGTIDGTGAVLTICNGYNIINFRFMDDGAITNPATAMIEQRNGTTAQSNSTYTTYTSATSYERLNFKGKASANFELGPENGSAGGTLRGLTIGGYSAGSSTITPWLTFTTTGDANFAGKISRAGLLANIDFHATDWVWLKGGNGTLIDHAVCWGPSYASRLLTNGNLTCGQIIETPPSSVTLSTNGQFSVEMTSDTTGNLVYRGSDGTTRRSPIVFT